MRFGILLILVFACSISYCQEEYAYADNAILSIPNSQTESTGAIAAWINQNFTAEKDRLRAAYKWVTTNIRYDKDSMYVFNWGADPGKKISAALRRRKGVCENFAALFTDIVQHCGYRSYTVNGYTKQNGMIDKYGHTWCAVFTNRQWLFCDPTWDAGFVKQANYFLVSPADFIESHMPFDPIWQFIDPPVTTTEFYRDNFLPIKNKLSAAVADSLEAYLQLSSVMQLEASIARIKRSDKLNELSRSNLLFLEMQAGIYYENTDSSFYQEAVDHINKALATFNEFVAFRNNQFKPTKPDNSIRSMLSDCEKEMNVSIKALNELDNSVHNVQYNSSNLHERIMTLQKKLAIQKEFLEQYLAATEEERKKMLYQ